MSFGALCHAIDDLIDQDNPEVKDEKGFILDVAQLAMDVYSSGFYHNTFGCIRFVPISTGFMGIPWHGKRRRVGGRNTPTRFVVAATK